MSRRGVFGAAAVVTALAAIVGWWHYYPVSPLITRLGLPGPRADAERHCGRGFRYYHRIRLSTGDIICQPRRSTGFAQGGNVNLDPLTRRVKYAMRMFAPPDSISWTAARDSIRREMSGHGGRPIRCYPAYDKNLPWIVSVEAWRFPGYTVRFIAYHFTPSWQSPTGPPTWLLQLDGYSGDPPGCGEAPLRPTPPPF
jgi:hypothetical protein